ncbi:hypothetical protein BgAZ_205710 [Babesia gibsoni]|uniref:Uncharacterized protein n=1 Tax=Babesia gibsoni TaxID=33632 RepID=A0AAD8LT65_BABGI|nr:hypothetical protein BgAZ_205710 [Babesia gibsoni]
MTIDRPGSPTTDSYKSHGHGMYNISSVYKENADLDSVSGDVSYGNAASSVHGGSCPSESNDAKGTEFSDCYTPASSNVLLGGRDVPKVVKTKSLKDLECEESLRRIHSLTVGDSVYFRRVVLGMENDHHDSKMGDYVEGKVVCFSFDKNRRYVVITLDGYGFLKFTFGDLYRMSIDKNTCLQRLQHPGALAKSIKQRRQRLDYEDEYMLRRFGGHYGMATEESDNIHSRDEHSVRVSATHHVDKAESNPEKQEIRTRPVPPGVETFCKCRFINKVDLVRKLRAMIYQNKQLFYEKTAGMQELRLIMTQNIRAYELEMVAYLMEEDPWNHSANPYERPSEEGLKAILDQYREAVSSQEYVTQFAQWQKYQKALKLEAKAAAAAASQAASSTA